MDAADVKSMFEGISPEWRAILSKSLKQEFSSSIMGVNTALGAAHLTKAALCPEPGDILNAFRLTDFGNLKVVLLGQDPYINKSEAMGLSFSVRAGVKNPPSLRMIFECLMHQGMISPEDPKPMPGDLTNWARQGVLLINAALTTIAGKSNEHAQIWAPYTDAIIREIDSQKTSVVFILLGGFAQKKAALIKRNKVLRWGHPSPLNTANKSDNPQHFKYCDVFRRANEILIECGHAPIDWNPLHETPASLNARERPENAPEDEGNKIIPDPVNKDDRNEVHIMKLMAGPADPALLDDKIYLFTDGGSSSNGKINCKASYAFYLTDGCDIIQGRGFVDDVPIAGEEYRSSNNRGELTGLLRGIEQLEAFVGPNRLREAEIVVVSDSEYALNSIDVWCRNWLADPTKYKLDSKKNLDLILPLNELLDKLRAKGMNIKLKHTRGHQNEPADKESEEWFFWKCNDIVDRLCNVQLGRI